VRIEGIAPAAAPRIFRRIEAELARVERSASLHADSELARLNRDGRLAGPSAGLRELLDLAGRVHEATGGAFDPTVQPLWLATARGGDRAAAAALVGWGRVRIHPGALTIGRGQALTLNGIAQGWAADRIAAILRAEGIGNVLIDMGEIAALGRRSDGLPWRAGVAEPGGETIATLDLTDRALATSSPRGTLIGDGRPHILGPAGQPPLWSTVAVSAPLAAVADALSTAFCLMDRIEIDRALAAFPGARVEAIV
jgi:thiamine biosynthesis lipoprotein